MKDKFFEYYSLSSNELTDLWEKAIFTIDTCVLLDLYRLSNKTSYELLKIFEKLKSTGQLWIANRVGYEFHEDREGVIAVQQDEYDRLWNYLTKDFCTGVTNNFRKVSNSHSQIKVDKYILELSKHASKIAKRIKSQKSKHPKDDSILDKVTLIFDGLVGDPYSPEDLSAIFDEGKTRYDKGIPPGFEDRKKDDIARKYGDLIIWYQIINKAKESNKPIILVTRDTKDDWWNSFNGKKNGPRRELRKEFREKTGQNFYLYEITNFIKIAPNYLGMTAVSENAQREIQQIVKEFYRMEVGNVGNSTAETNYESISIPIVEQSLVAEPKEVEGKKVGDQK